VFRISGVASPKCLGGKDFGGPKYLILGEQQYFLFGTPLLKAQNTRYAKKFWGPFPLPSLATPVFRMKIYNMEMRNKQPSISNRCKKLKPAKQSWRVQDSRK